MPVTRENLEARLVALKAQREQLVANGNAVGGAIQLVEALLQEFVTQPQGSAEVVDAEVVLG